jgi:transposase
MERIVERPGALDVHKASVTACVRVWQGRELQERMAEFATTVHGLLALRDWLEALGVRQVAMEATGVYWKPVWAVLEDRFELMLVNARHVKQVPGPKTDIKDAQWLCQLLEAATDPNVLADLARGQLRKKLPALREALVGRFADEQARRCGRSGYWARHISGGTKLSRNASSGPCGVSGRWETPPRKCDRAGIA